MACQNRQNKPIRETIRVATMRVRFADTIDILSDADADDGGLVFLSIETISGSRSVLKYTNSGMENVSLLCRVCRAAIPSTSWNKFAACDLSGKNKQVLDVFNPGNCTSP